MRYFNPVGSHESGRIGEDPTGVPQNLMPYIAQVAVGKQKMLKIFGRDWPTEDGTGVRDYIHIVDLAEGHLAALDKLGSGILKCFYENIFVSLTTVFHQSGDLKGFNVFNLGTGVGYSVLDMMKNFSAASGCDIPYEFVPRREGDIASCYASTEKAEKELGWKARKGLKEMCEDTWRWQKNNPQGFAGLKSDL